MKSLKKDFLKFTFEISCCLVIFAAGMFVIEQNHSPVIAHAQSSSQTPCVVVGTFTTSGVSTQLDNRNLGCYQFRVNYSSTGFSALSIQLEQAPDNGGVPGSWTAFTGTAVTDGTNPSTSIVGAIIGVHSNAPWLRLNLSTVTGTGKVTYQVWGANSTQNIAKGALGGTGATGASGATGATGSSGVTGMIQVANILASQTTTVGSTNLFTTPSGNHSFMYLGSIYCTAATAAATVALSATWVDPSGTTQAPAASSITCTTLGVSSRAAFAGIMNNLQVQAASSITYATTVTGGPAPYQLSLQLYQLN